MTQRNKKHRENAWKFDVPTVFPFCYNHCNRYFFHFIMHFLHKYNFCTPKKLIIQGTLERTILKIDIRKLLSFLPLFYLFILFYFLPKKVIWNDDILKYFWYIFFTIWTYLIIIRRVICKVVQLKNTSDVTS